MVDAGDFPLQVIDLVEHVDVAQQSAGAGLDRMTEADGADLGLAQNSAGEGTHGVGVVEQPGIGADLLHIAGEIEHDRKGAQDAEDAADADGVGDGLTQTILFGDLEVGDGAGVVAADLYGVDDEIGAAQGFAPLASAEVGFYFGPPAVDFSVEAPYHGGRFAQALLIDIVEGYF